MGIEYFKQFWNGKRVLITGNTGFKGAWLSMILSQMGATVSGYSLEPPTKPSLFELCKLSTEVNTEIADICDEKNIRNFMLSQKPEIVFHLAAQPLVRLSYKEPLLTYQTNIIGTLNVLEAVRATDSVKALINITTDKCYENNEWHWGYRENDRLGGYDPYSSSKACAEIVTAAYRNSFFNNNSTGNHQAAIATARAGNVIGGGDWADDRLIPDFIRALIKNEAVIIRSPYAIRPWQHVLEPLSGYMMLAQKLYTEGQKFAQSWNFGPNDEDAKPVQWIINRLCEKWGGGASFSIDHSIQPHEAHYLKLDCSKAKNELAWIPKWNLEYAIDSIIEFSKAWMNGNDIKAIVHKQIYEYFTT